MKNFLFCAVEVWLSFRFLGAPNNISQSASGHSTFYIGMKNMPQLLKIFDSGNRSKMIENNMSA